MEFRRRIPDVDAIGRRILADDEKFLHARLHQPLCFIEHRRDGARNEVAADRRDDAEGAAVVAALGNLEVGIMLRCQVQALRWHQVHLGIVDRRQRLVDGSHHGLILVRARHGEDPGVRLHDRVGLDPHAAGDDHPAVLGHGLADGGQRFRLCAVEEAAGIDQHHVCIRVAGRHDVALGTQLCDDAFRVDQRLGAAEGNQSDLGDMLVHVGVLSGGGRKAQITRASRHFTKHSHFAIIRSMATSQFRHRLQWGTFR